MKNILKKILNMMIALYVLIKLIMTIQIFILKLVVENVRKKIFRINS